MTSFDVLVVGAGPAGLSAAAAAAGQGASVLVVDESFRVGGQYFRPRGQVPVAHPLLTRLGGLKVEVALNEPLWHLDHGARLAVTRTRHVKYRTLVIATGAFDRPTAVPGSDLDGVFLAGAVQALSKDGCRVGNQVLIAGAGPFSLAVAYEVLLSGGNVAEISFTHLPRMLGSAVHAPQVLWEAARFGKALASSRVPVRSGWVLTSIRGKERVEGAVLTSLKGSKRQRVVDCDAVALCYGFLPQLAVADLAGCSMVFDPVQRTWFVQATEETLETSVSGVFAAGEILEIGGHRKAIAEGKVAGLSAAAAALGQRTAASPDALRVMRRARKFAAAAQRAMTPPPLAEFIADSAVVCRCEEVTAGQIRAAVRDGADMVHGVRMRTRCGMGVCQARMCGQLCAEIVAATAHSACQAAGRVQAKTPVRPVALGDVAR